MKHSRLVEIFLGFLAAFALVLTFRALSTIFIPLSFATLLAFMFGPFVRRLTNRKIPKYLVLTFLMLLIFVVFLLLGLVIYSGLTSFMDEIPKYSTKMTDLLDTITLQFSIMDEHVKNFIREIDWYSIVDPSTITGLITNTMGSFTTFLGKLFLVLLFMLFMLAGRNKLEGRLNRSLSEERSQQALKILNSIEDQVQKYLLTKTIVSLLTAILGLVVLVIAGVDFFILFALLIFILNFIPTFGSIVATILPILVCFFEFSFSWRIIFVASGLTAIQMTIGNYLDPKLMGRGLNLSPLLILIALIFWGWVWGIIGMILAVPLTSAMKIVFEHIRPLKPLASMMSGD